eukprot:5119704-Pleurochrysis_carterae.AAC.4
MVAGLGFFCYFAFVAIGSGPKLVLTVLVLKLEKTVQVHTTPRPPIPHTNFRIYVEEALAAQNRSCASVYSTLMWAITLVLSMQCSLHRRRLGARLSVQLENTCGENKNLTVIAFLGWLVLNKTFVEAGFFCMMKGHTVSVLDQSFSTLIGRLRSFAVYTISRLVDLIALPQCRKRCLSVAISNDIANCLTLPGVSSVARSSVCTIVCCRPFGDVVACQVVSNAPSFVVDADDGESAGDEVCCQVSIALNSAAQEVGRDDGGSLTSASQDAARNCAFVVVLVRRPCSLPSHGGDGASFSSMPPLSMSLLSSIGAGPGDGGQSDGGRADGADGACGVNPGEEVSMKREWGETQMRLDSGSKHMCPGWLRTRQPIGRTPAQEGTTPVNRNQGEWLGVSRRGSMAETSVDDFK